MPLKKCRYCGKTIISVNTKHCHYCGAPIRTYKSAWIVLFLLTVTLSVVFYIVKNFAAVSLF